MGYVGRLTTYALKHRGLFIGFLFFAGLGTVFNVFTPLVLAHLIDEIILKSQFDLVIPYTLLYLTLAGFFGIFDMIGRYGAAMVAQNVIYDLRSELYDSLMEKDLAFYDENETGQLLARVTTDVTTMREFLLWGYRVIFIGIATMIAAYVMMWYISPDLTLYMFLLIPFIILFIINFAKRVRPVFYAARSQYGVLSSVLAENVTGMKVVQSYAAAERETERVRKENQGFLELRVKALRLVSFYRPLLPTVFGIATGFLIYLGGVEFVLGGLTYGTFVAYLSLLGMLILPARFMTWGTGMYQRASAAGERTFYILDHRDALLNPEVPFDIEDLQGTIEFDKVFFSYGGDNFILQDISLRVNSGQIVALVGGTGSGKTSLVNLISRFYDVDNDDTICYKDKTYRVEKNGKVQIGDDDYYSKEGVVEIGGQTFRVRPPGTISIDGVDVRLYKLEDLRKNVGMVHQDPFLFSATVRENISFAKPNASLEEVQEAAKAAMIHDFILSLDEQYDSIVGERGVTLSGGQKQRIAIARALLSDPRILVLDDSTSSVDAKTEAMIQRALDNLMVGRTTFIITHRLSTVRNADLIVMMESGRIVEHGNHDELIAKGGLYSGIYQTLSEMETIASEAEAMISEAKPTGGKTNE